MMEDKQLKMLIMLLDYASKDYVILLDGHFHGAWLEYTDFEINDKQKTITIF